ncbi:hypothetical protein SUGI_0816660 [Cryptomeria japonica]|nr:hypothetical protein SUGI_0816660 [Cryptomeria japonica]
MAIEETSEHGPRAIYHAKFCDGASKDVESVYYMNAHGEVCGNYILMNRDESGAAQSKVLVETTRSVQQGEIVSRGDKQINVSVCEVSQYVLFISKDSLANGVSMDFRDRGERSEVFEPIEVSEKLETFDLIMPRSHNFANIDDAEKYRS